ncbi:MAG: hypothetical protein H6739_10690 [Alphaproteobacteria bacterium]|nr:hypothetical protein [Alphaproteobacteria bacterium]
MTEPPLSPAEKLRLALEMYEVGEEMMRQRLKREHPGQDAEAIEARLVRWLEERPITGLEGWGRVRPVQE